MQLEKKKKKPFLWPLDFALKKRESHVPFVERPEKRKKGKKTKTLFKSSRKKGRKKENAVRLLSTITLSSEGGGSSPLLHSAAMKRKGSSCAHRPRKSSSRQAEKETTLTKSSAFRPLRVRKRRKKKIASNGPSNVCPSSSVACRGGKGNRKGAFSSLHHRHKNQLLPGPNCCSRKKIRGPLTRL